MSKGNSWVLSKRKTQSDSQQQSCSLQTIREKQQRKTLAAELANVINRKTQSWEKRSWRGN